MEQATITRNPIADPMRNPITYPRWGKGKTLIARTDGRTNERVSHLLDKSSSYVTRRRFQGINSTQIIRNMQKGAVA